MTITIDGPTASGKSTVARLVAQQLGIYYLNSGILYRALAYLLIHHAGYTLETLSTVQPEHVKEYLDPKRFVYRYDGGYEHIFFDTVDITPYLKTSQMDQGSSIVSTNMMVRQELTQFQRTIAQKNDLVIDGRDCGSYVLPNATVKIFLTALPAVRALRWQHEQERKGNVFTQEQALEQLMMRDKRDAQRSVAPLVVPEGAVVIDNSVLSLHETVHRVLDVIKGI